jgi:hypothetical protein
MHKNGRADLRLTKQIHNEINQFKRFDLGHEIYHLSILWIGQGTSTMTGRFRCVPRIFTF